MGRYQTADYHDTVHVMMWAMVKLDINVICVQLVTLFDNYDFLILNF